MSDLPTIRLGGKDYPVKPLVLRQLKIVDPAWARMRKDPQITMPETWDDIIEIVYQSIAPSCEPPMTRAAFLDLPITKLELYASLKTIATQAGMIMKEPEPGEAASPLIGTGLSPSSATSSSEAGKK